MQTIIANEEKTFLFDVVDQQSPEPNLAIAMNVHRQGGATTRIEHHVEGMRAWKEEEVEREVDQKIARFVAARDRLDVVPQSWPPNAANPPAPVVSYSEVEAKLDKPQSSSGPKPRLQDGKVVLDASGRPVGPEVVLVGPWQVRGSVVWGVPAMVGGLMLLAVGWYFRRRG